MKYRAAAIRMVKIDEVAKLDIKRVSEARRADFMKIMAMPGRRLMLKVASVTSFTASASSSGEAPASWARVSARTVLSRSQRVARKSADMSRVAQARRVMMPRSFPSR